MEINLKQDYQAGDICKIIPSKKYPEANKEFNGRLVTILHKNPFWPQYWVRCDNKEFAVGATIAPRMARIAAYAFGNIKQLRQ